MKYAIWILWPSFIAGAVGTVLLFSILDPVDLRFVGPLELGRKAGYTVSFFSFWALAAGRAGLPTSWKTSMRAASLLILLLPLCAAAQDAARGRVLYQTYCGGCHYERMHDERLRPAVRDLADLRDMVAQWAPQTKRSYTLDELEDIVQYLNESHYRFALPPRRKP